jgi:hypothetical protein
VTLWRRSNIDPLRAAVGGSRGARSGATSGARSRLRVVWHSRSPLPEARTSALSPLHSRGRAPSHRQSNSPAHRFPRKGWQASRTPRCSRRGRPGWLASRVLDTPGLAASAEDEHRVAFRRGGPRCGVAEPKSPCEQFLEESLSQCVCAGISRNSPRTCGLGQGGVPAIGSRSASPSRNGRDPMRLKAP